MDLPFEYSPGEIALINALDVMKSATNPGLPPVLLWQILAIASFRRNILDNVHEQVRHGLRSMEALNPRLTPEFEYLITKDYKTILLDYLPVGAAFTIIDPKKYQEGTWIKTKQSYGNNTIYCVNEEIQFMHAARNLKVTEYIKK